MQKTIKGAKLLKKGIKNRNLKKKLGEKCVYCGCDNKLILTIDHKNPLSRGGLDEDSNKQVTCYICNQLKGSLTHKEFLKYRKILNNLKDLHKIKIELLQPKLIFMSQSFPKELKDIIPDAEVNEEEEE